MKVRLRDFAELNRISERTVQVHIKENIDVLETHVERRGKQGTWLDEYAQEFLLERIQLPGKDDVYLPSAREAALMAKLSDVYSQLADAERRAGENAEAAGKVLLLEEGKKEQTKKIDVLTRENALLSADNAEKGKILKDKELKLKNASDELTVYENMSVLEFIKRKLKRKKQGEVR